MYMIRTYYKHSMYMVRTCYKHGTYMYVHGIYLYSTACLYNRWFLISELRAVESVLRSRQLRFVLKRKPVLLVDSDSTSCERAFRIVLCFTSSLSIQLECQLCIQLGCQLCQSCPNCNFTLNSVGIPAV